MSVDVSTVIPAFRRPAQLVEAIQSALEQAGVSVEVIVIDDSPEGSAKPTVARLSDPRITYQQQRQPSGGKPAIVRNDGFHLATGRYVHFLDDDDHVAPGAYRALVTALDRRPRTGVAFGWVCPFGDDPAVLREKTAYFTRAAQVARAAPSRFHIVATILFKGALMVNSACLIRRKGFGPLGGFDPAIRYYEDVEFWMRAIRRLGYVFVDRPILEYRTGATSLIHDLQGNWTPVHEAYRVMHAKYRREHGLVEYAGLKLLSLRLPSVSASADEQKPGDER